MAKCRRFSTEFKAKVALEAIRGVNRAQFVGGSPS
jgi:hypothetical protein